MGKRGRPARIIRCAKPAKCPKCGNRHFLIVVYGYPSNDIPNDLLQRISEIELDVNNMSRKVKLELNSYSNLYDLQPTH